MTPMEMQAAAQADADRFYGDGPAQPWQPGDDEPAAPRWPWVVAGVMVLITAATGWAATRYIDSLTTPAQPRTALAAPQRDVASLTGDPDEDLIDDPAPAPRPAAQTPMQPGSTQFTVSRQRREWHIEANGASRLLVAQRLAEVTGSSLRGDLSLLNTTRPLDLQWQGRGALQAWQAVLGQELSFLTQCSASRCRVWLLQAGQGHDTAFQMPPPRPIIPLPSVETIEVAAASPAASSTRPSDSSDPRVAAHHD